MEKPLAAVASLYRKFSRQIRRFPDVYVQRFFRYKLSDDTRKILSSTESQRRFRQRLARFTKELHKVEAANAGDRRAFAHVLDLAYGRKGRLRWEIMEPLLSDPNKPLPPPIIEGKPDSRPPVYSPELSALLLSAHSRTTKSLQKTALATSGLPARADPSSEEARLLGPLSKRREVNLRWRFFTDEWKKVIPPVQLTCKEALPADREMSSSENLARLGLRPIGMQGLGVLEHVERLARPPTATLTRRERRATGTHPPPSDVAVPRWVRRRYQQLLGRMPILTYRSSRKTEGSYELMPSMRFGSKIEKTQVSEKCICRSEDVYWGLDHDCARVSDLAGHSI